MKYAIMPFNVILLAPIMEELVYRRIIFRGIERRAGFWTGAIVSSLLFAAGHFDPSRLPAYFVTGLVFCAAYRRSGTITVSILAHITLNLLSVVARTLQG